MSKQDLQTSLNSAMKALNDRWARGDMARFRQVVTITIDDLAVSMFDGYLNAMSIRPAGSYPQIRLSTFKKEAARQIPILYNMWAGGADKSISVVKRGYNGKFLRVHMNKEEPQFYQEVKELGILFVNKKLKSAGKEGLGGSEKEFSRRKGLGLLSSKQEEQGSQIWRSTSEAGRFKSGYNISHEGGTTVGAARLVAAADWIQNSKYKSFLGSEEFRTLNEKYKEFKVIFSTDGMDGADLSDTKLKLNENMRVSATIGPMSRNYSGSEINDWRGKGGKGIGDRLNAALAKWAAGVDWTKQKGSKSIREHAKEVGKTAALRGIIKSKAVNKNKSSKPVAVPDREEKLVSTRGKGGTLKKPRSKGKAVKAYPRVKSSAGSKNNASLYTVMALINDKLPETVRKNMGAPRLENQTGRFASSVKLTDVIQTPQGFPSFGYTYRKDPYGVYERSSGTSRADPDRDPRDLIDASIREIAAGYALGRFYTRRV